MVEKLNWNEVLAEAKAEGCITEKLGAAFLVIANTHFEIVKIHPDDRDECFDRAYDRLLGNYLKLDASKSPRNYMIQMVKYAIKDFYKASNTNKRSILRRAQPLENYEK
jgi:hypothetical protein